MFTGIVQATGTVKSWEKRGQDARLRISSPELDISSIARGDSIAVSGVCLTATAVQDDVLHVDVSAETLSRSTLGRLKPGGQVNLETALTLKSRLGGHLVSGHVDGVGEVIRREQVGGSVRFTFGAPLALGKYIAEKGSICIDGVSLTVNKAMGANFEVNIIAHTLEVTTFNDYVHGTCVNLEVDLIARYLERLILGDQIPNDRGEGITRDFLARHGFGNET